MSKKEKNIKRFFDVFLSLLGLILIGWFILCLIIVSSILLEKFGVFKQKRVGRYGQLFVIYKIRTIHPLEANKQNPKILKVFKFIRKHKLDELPQLYNVLIGHMSFVGPRPDLPKVIDKIPYESKQIILSVKPGITGPATLFFRNEEELLSKKDNPQQFNKEVIWPKKKELNLRYVQEYSFLKDILYICKTVCMCNYEQN